MAQKKSPKWPVFVEYIGLWNSINQQKILEGAQRSAKFNFTFNQQAVIVYFDAERWVLM